MYLHNDFPKSQLFVIIMYEIKNWHKEFFQLWFLQITFFLTRMNFRIKKNTQSNATYIYFSVGLRWRYSTQSIFLESVVLKWCSGNPTRLSLWFRATKLAIDFEFANALPRCPEVLGLLESSLWESSGAPSNSWGTIWCQDQIRIAPMQSIHLKSCTISPVS